MQRARKSIAWLAVTLVAAGPLLADPGDRETRTAEVTLGGTPLVNFTVDIRDVGNPLVDTNPPVITWTANAGDPWTLANQLLLLNATVTNATGGIQIYTDNTAPDANPRFEDATPDTSDPGSNPAGMVRVEPDNTSSKTVPLAWSVKASSKTAGGGDPTTGIQAADPNSGPTDGAGNRFQWLFMKDRATPTIPSENTTAFANGEPYATVINVEGIHFGGAPTEFGFHADAADAFIYLESNFANTIPQETYRTNKLTLEAFAL